MEIGIELLNESDFPTIMKWINAHDADFIVQWAGLTYTYPLTLQQMRNHYHRGINSLEADVFIYKVIDRSTDEMIGSLQLCRFDQSRREAVIGRFIIGEEQHRGRGIGKQALSKVVEIGFTQFGLQSVKLNVFDINKAAIRCYEQVGFRIGKVTERVYQSSKGVIWNNYEMTLSKADWEADSKDSA